MVPRHVFASVIVVCLTATAVAQESEATKLLRNAGSLFSQGSFKEAAEQAQAAAKLAPEDVNIMQRAAEIVYRSGYARESLPLFDRVVELAPESAPENWQRGIALCNCGEWEKGAQQFKTHHDVNPDDVENSAWYFLCIAKTEGMEAARQTVIPSRGDGRQPMMSVLKMLQGKIEPNEVIAAALSNTAAGTSARKQAQFYADLYVGLYYDCLADAEQAKKYFKRSQSYGVQGYMPDVARVYLQDRFPAAPPNESKN